MMGVDYVLPKSAIRVMRSVLRFAIQSIAAVENFWTTRCSLKKSKLLNRNQSYFDLIPGKSAIFRRFSR